MLLPLVLAISLLPPRIAYTKDGHVWLTDIGGKSHKKIASGLVYDRPIEASPDGKHVIVWDHSQGHWDLVRVEVSTGKKLNLTSKIHGGCRMASYSPDCRTIAFMSDEPNGLYLMNADGSGQRRVSTKGHRDNRPLWSKDGKRILFSDLPEHNRNIYVIKPDGTGERALALGSDPIFAPSGGSVVYCKGGSIQSFDLKRGESGPFLPGVSAKGRTPRFFGGKLMYVQGTPDGGEAVHCGAQYVWTQGVRDVVVDPAGTLFALQDDDSLRIVNKQFYPKTIVKGKVGGVAWLR